VKSNNIRSIPIEPLLIARPMFKPLPLLIAFLPLHVFLTFWATGFFGGFAWMALEALHIAVPGRFVFTAIGALVFFGLPALACLFKSKWAAGTEYRIYRDRIEYTERHWRVEMKTVQLGNVIEVTMHQGPLQRRHGLGTVRVSTAAHTGEGAAANGVQIAEIERPERVYELLLELTQR